MTDASKGTEKPSEEVLNKDELLGGKGQEEQEVEGQAWMRCYCCGTRNGVGWGWDYFICRRCGTTNWI